MTSLQSTVQAAAAALLLMVACGPAKVTGGLPGGGRGPNGPSGGGGSSGAGAGGGITLPTTPGSAGTSSADAGAPSGAMPGEACAEEAFRAQSLPVDVLLLVDRSGSMKGSAGTSTKWQLAREALVAFIRDPRSAGLGVGLQFFPPRSRPFRYCNADSDCGDGFACLAPTVCVGPTVGTMIQPCDPVAPAASNGCPGGATCRENSQCSMSRGYCDVGGAPCPGGAGDICKPFQRFCLFGGCEMGNYLDTAVPIAGLPGGADAAVSYLMATEPQGGTPMGPAVQGTLAGLRNRLTKNPSRTAVMVLVTDGVPAGCQPATIPELAQLLSAARSGTPSILTYVIGTFGDQGALDTIAAAGSGSKAFILDPNETLAGKLLEALNQIRGMSLPCEFMLPASMAGALDYGRLNLRLKSPVGDQDILYVARADRCDPAQGGWYYDVDPAMGKPTRVVVCPATCSRFKSEMSASVDLRIGCKTRVVVD